MKTKEETTADIREKYPEATWVKRTAPYDYFWVPCDGYFKVYFDLVAASMNSAEL